MLQREVQRAEEESRRSQSIITDYKQICSKLGRRLEEEQSRAKDIWQQWKGTLSDCPNCSALVNDLSGLINGSDHQSASPDQSVVIGNKSPPGSPTAPSPFELQVSMSCLVHYRLFSPLSISVRDPSNRYDDQLKGTRQKSSFPEN